MKKNLYTKKDDLNRSAWERPSQWYQIVCLLLFFIALSQVAQAQISGVVYRDFNEDGVRSYTATAAGEIGVSGVTVNVYNSSGLVGTTTTSSATATVGTYSITPSGVGPYRVEFVNLPSGYYDGLHGSASGTSVQFVASAPATNVNLGINYPTDYCQAAPNFLVPCYVNGDPTGGGNSGTQGVLVTLPYSSTGNNPAEVAITTNVQIGTVFGVAYQRTSKVIFTSAFVKRHSGLGTDGAGAIYITKPGSGTTYTSSLFVTLPTAVSAVSAAAIGGTTVVGTNAARSLPASTTTVNYDAATFDQVGKAGLGDIELSEDGTQLYAVNLGDRKLYQIPINNASTTNPTAATASIVSYAIPTVTQATGSVLRPFALKVYRGRVYVGAVTTNEAVSTTVNSGTGSTGGTTPLITRDPSTMVAYVFEFNPANSSFTTVLSFPLSYTKGATDNDQTGVSRSDRWYPWASVQPSYPTATAGQLPNRYSRNDLANASYPQPMLSGIEFDVDGSMILSIRDRFGDQYGNNNYGTNTASTQLYRAIAPGDILRAGQCTPGVNLWTLESNARVCSGPATLGANTNQGPGGGEYYYSDAIALPNTTNPYHAEMSEGGLALFPGTGEVASIVLDPTDAVDAGGIRRFKNSDGSGSPSTSVQIYASSNVATFGKANGLGDVEINCDLPPIQIGNRVFRDVNNNGIQDPGEPGLAGVQVVLRGPGSTTIATATTDANGEYYFSSATGTSTASSIANLTLTAGGSYTLSFPTSVSAFSISTFPNAGTGSNGEAIDSDPSAAGVISFTLGAAGENNFTYDAGYACTPLALTLTSGTICAGQTVSLTATSGFSSYTFSSGLTQVGTTNVASGSVNGTYSVTAVNSFGCSGTATGSITVNALPVVTLSSATICAGQTASLIATAGLSSYTFSSGLTQIGATNVATGTVGGTYSVTAANAAGCSATATGSITVNSIPALTLTSATVCAGQTASLTAVGAGFATYAFSTNLTQVGTTNVASGTAAGTYSVTATTALGCSATATGSITVNPVPALALTSATVCAGQPASLTAAGTGFATYVFSSGLTQVGTTNVASSTAAGTYSVTATTALGCSATATGSITVNPVPALTLSSATICAGQTATLTAGGTGFTTYVFSSSLTHIGTTNQATGTTAGTYSVTATTALGCSATATGSITVNPVPALTLTSATVCAGQPASLTAVGTGFATYVFSSGLTQVGTTNVASSTAAGTYSVTATTALGCSATATGSITTNPIPALTLTSATICAGQTANLTASTGFATYVFSSGLTQVGTTNVASSTVAGTYSVTATTSLGCSATATGTVIINPTAVVNLTSATICAGQLATLTATSGFSSYVFSSGLTQIGSSNVATSATNGTYSVTATTASGCSGTATGSVTVNALPTVTLSSATICAGQTASLIATAGLSSYTFSSGLTQIGATNVATGTVGDTYLVTATNAAGCSASATGSITVNSIPALTLTSATVCAGQPASLTAVGAGFATYVFSSGLTQVGTSNVAIGIAAGTYSVTATTALGCSATATGSITVNPLPVVTLSSATICSGQSATLIATAGYASYSFSTGLIQDGSSNIATGTVDGTYSVTVTTLEGCSATATGSLTVNPTPVVALSSMTICDGQVASLTVTAGYDSYSFSAGLTPVPGTPNVATGTIDGIYSVTAISTEGCSATATGSITVNPAVVVTLSSATICAGQVGVLTATTGYDTYIFSAGITQDGTTNVASGTVAGTYSVTAISNAGCVGTATGTISVNPTAIITLSSATICAGQSATLTATDGFTNYSFSAGLTPVAGEPNLAIGTVDGIYSVTASTSAGCQGSATGTITVNPQPAALITASSTTICQGQSATLTASGGDLYTWSTGEQSASIVVTTSDVYSVTVSTVNGCSDISSTTITVNPLPVLTVNSATVCSGQSATLTIGGCEGGTVLWSTAESTATILVSPSITTTYSATCTLSTGCVATTATTVTVNDIPSYTAAPQAITATCTGSVANNDARIELTTLQNTERADIVVGSTYGSGPAYGAPTNLMVTSGAVSFTNLPNPGTSQAYTIRLYNPGGTCYTDVTVILEPSICNCPAPKCVPLVIQKTKVGR
jgi:hypothetical protein